MTRNQILSVYCSIEDCKEISKEKKKSFSGIYIETTVIKSKLSLKKICAHRKKRYPIKAGDYIIAIDSSPVMIFSNDIKTENLLHFSSLNQFFEWLEESFR